MNNEELREFYNLRRLLEETQIALGMKPRKSEATGLPHPLTADERAAQLRALLAAHKRLMVDLRRKLDESGLGRDPALSREENHERSLERNRRENFARTIHASVRQHVERGGDLRRLIPETATKQALREDRVPLPAPKTFTEKLERQAESVRKMLMNLDARIRQSKRRK